VLRGIPAISIRGLRLAIRIVVAIVVIVVVVAFLLRGGMPLASATPSSPSTLFRVFRRLLSVVIVVVTFFASPVLVFAEKQQ